MAVGVLTLDQLLAGPHNQAALAAARRLCTSPGAVTPLLVTGPSGVGKTCLLRAIAHELGAPAVAARVRLVSGADLAAACVETVAGHLAALRDAYAGLGALLVDGLEDLLPDAHARDILDELIAGLVARGRPVVLATGPLPDEDRRALVARVRAFPTGLVAHLAYPSRAARVDAVHRLLGPRLARVPAHVITLAASRTRTIAETVAAVERILLVRETAREAGRPT